MGSCVIAGRCQDGFTKEDCDLSKGSYSQDSCADKKTKDPPSTCLMAAALPTAAGEAILTIGLTYRHQVSFREQVLESTIIGRRFVKLYYEHKSRMISLGLHNLELLGEMFAAWMRILNFICATTAIAEGKKKSVPADHRKMIFPEEHHQRCVRLLDRMRGECDCEDFHAFLDAVEKELARYVGLTPEQALATIRRDDSKRKK